MSSDDRPFVLVEADREFAWLLKEAGPSAARRWYWSQAWRSLGPGAVSRLRRSTWRSFGVGSAWTGWTQALRTARRRPGYHLLLIGTLTLGAVSATTVLTLAHGLLLRPLPYPDPHTLVSVTSFDERRGLLPDRDLSGPDYYDLVERNRVFATLAAYEIAPAAIAGERGGVTVDVGRVTPSFFALLGITPTVGRVFHHHESGRAAPRHAIVSHQFAVRRFGHPESALESTLEVDGESYLIVGVVRRAPPLPAGNLDVWFPLPYGPTSLRRQAGVFGVLGRVADRTSLDAVQTDVTRIAAMLETEYPDSNLGRRLSVTGLHDTLTGNLRPAMAAFTLAVSLLIGIAVINGAGLVMVRQLRRDREFAIRRAVGGSDGDLLAQLGAEAIIVGGVTGLISGAVSSFLVANAGRLMPGDQPQFVLVDTQTTPFGLALVVGLCAAVAATAVAVRLVRVGTGSLRGAEQRVGRTRTWLLGSQVAAATVLIVAVTLLGSSLRRLVATDPGFTPDQLVSVALDLPSATYPTDMRVYPNWSEIQAFYNRARLAIQTQPEIETAAIAWHHPLRRGWLTRFIRRGEENIPEGERDMINLRSVSPGYFATVGAQLLTGRDVSDTDDVGSEPVVVVNRAFARQYFPEGGAVGETISFFGRWWRIVGVVGDFKSQGLTRETRPAVFPPLPQMPSETMHVVARGAGTATDLISSVTEAIWSVDRQLAPYDPQSLEIALSDESAEHRFMLVLFSAFGALALTLSIVGLSGAAAETVESRRRELGVRAALGATRGQLFRLATGSTTRACVAGIAAGLLGAALLTPFLETWLFQISARSPSVFSRTALVLLGSGLVAAAAPVIRALRDTPRELLGR